MTVSELITELSRHPPDMPVAVFMPDIGDPDYMPVHHGVVVEVMVATVEDEQGWYDLPSLPEEVDLADVTAQLVLVIGGL